MTAIGIVAMIMLASVLLTPVPRSVVEALKKEQEALDRKVEELTK